MRVFGIETSVGVTVDNVNNDGKDGLIVFGGKRLDSSSALVAGKKRVDKLVSGGGSALTGDNYANVLLLSDQATNKQRGCQSLGMGTAPCYSAAVRQRFVQTN